MERLSALANGGEKGRVTRHQKRKWNIKGFRPPQFTRTGSWGIILRIIRPNMLSSDLVTALKGDIVY